MKKSNKKDQIQVHFRASQSQWEELKKRAAALDLTLSNYMLEVGLGDKHVPSVREIEIREMLHFEVGSVRLLLQRIEKSGVSADLKMKIQEGINKVIETTKLIEK